MKQQTLAMASGFEGYGKKTRRVLVLEEMEQVVPWTELCALIEPVYAKAGNGRPPVGAERMLRIYFLQQWFNLSDPGVEEAPYDSAGMRQFVGIDLGREPAPDETTVCKFRHLLEQHELGERLCSCGTGAIGRRAVLAPIIKGDTGEKFFSYGGWYLSNTDPVVGMPVSFCPLPRAPGGRYRRGIEVAIERSSKQVHVARAPQNPKLTQRKILAGTSWHSVTGAHKQRACKQSSIN